MPAPKERGASSRRTQGWHHQDIVAGVRKAGTNLRALSIASGFAAGTLQAALYRRHPKAHQIIAQCLGVSCHVIWPHWYGPNGEALPTRSTRIRRAAA